MKRSWFTMLVAFVALASSVLAQGVVDNGKYFSADAVKNAETTIAGLDQRQIKVRVETYDRPPANGSSENDVRNYANRRARELKADVFVIANREPRVLRVIVPSGAKVPERLANDISAAIIDRFKASEFDAGLSEGLAMISATAGSAGTPTPRSNPRADPGNSSNVPTNPGPASPTPRKVGLCGNLGCFGIVLLVLAAFLVIKVLGSLFGGRRNPPGGGYGGYNTQGGGGGMFGGGGGGGFGSGLGGGILGGVLGSMLGGRIFGGSQSHANPPYDSGSGNDQPTFGGGDAGGSYDNSSGGDAGGSYDSGGGGGDSGGGGGDAGGSY